MLPLGEKGWYRLLRQASLLSSERRNSPVVGDIVIEMSKKIIDPTMIGELTEIEIRNGEKAYHVTSLDGERQCWIDVDVVVVEAKGTKVP